MFQIFFFKNFIFWNMVNKRKFFRILNIIVIFHRSNTSSTLLLITTLSLSLFVPWSPYHTITPQSREFHECLQSPDIWPTELFSLFLTKGIFCKGRERIVFFILSFLSLITNLQRKREMWGDFLSGNETEIRLGNPEKHDKGS